MPYSSIGSILHLMLYVKLCYLLFSAATAVQGGRGRVPYDIPGSLYSHSGSVFSVASIEMAGNVRNPCQQTLDVHLYIHSSSHPLNNPIKMYNNFQFQIKNQINDEVKRQARRVLLLAMFRPRIQGESSLPGAELCLRKQRQSTQ